jgi:hypothetical protein
MHPSKDINALLGLEEKHLTAVTPRVAPPTGRILPGLPSCKEAVDILLGEDGDDTPPDFWGGLISALKLAGYTATFGQCERTYRGKSYQEDCLHVAEKMFTVLSDSLEAGVYNATLIDEEEDYATDAERSNGPGDSRGEVDVDMNMSTGVVDVEDLVGYLEGGDSEPEDDDPRNPRRGQNGSASGAERY